jgi:hypothetical protein
VNRNRRRMILGLALSALCLQLSAGLGAGLAAQNQAKAPATATPPPAAQPANRPRFDYGGNAAAIPATFIQNVAFFPMRLNGSKPSLFAVDTSATVTSIDPSRAAEIGITPNQGYWLVFLGGAIPFGSVPAAARDDFATQIGRPYEGTLGVDFLSAVVAELDFGRETARIFDPSVYKYSGKGTVFPLRLSNGMPVIRVKFVSPRGKEVEADFAVDTSMLAGIVISEKFAGARKLVSSRAKPAKGYDPQLTGGEGVSLFRLGNFQIGHFTAPDIVAEFSHSKLADAGDPKLAGVIGGAMLRRFSVVLDYPHQQIIFEMNSHFKDYDEEDKSGIAVVAKGPGLKTFEIVNVEPGTPGAEAGIQKGDVIAGVDDEAAADMTLASIRNLFRQVGHTYKLLLQRGDQTKQVSVQMRRLL